MKDLRLVHVTTDRMANSRVANGTQRAVKEEGVVVKGQEVIEFGQLQNVHTPKCLSWKSNNMVNVSVLTITAKSLPVRFNLRAQFLYYLTCFHQGSEGSWLEWAWGTVLSSHGARLADLPTPLMNRPVPGSTKPGSGAGPLTWVDTEEWYSSFGCEANRPTVASHSGLRGRQLQRVARRRRCYAFYTETFLTLQCLNSNLLFLNNVALLLFTFMRPSSNWNMLLVVDLTNTAGNSLLQASTCLWGNNLISVVRHREQILTVIIQISFYMCHTGLN